MSRLRTLLLATVFACGVSCTPLPTYVLADDAGGGAEAGLPPSGSGATQCTHCLIFTTSNWWPGSLFGTAGVERADALCQTSGRNIPGKEKTEWKAFIWADGISPFERLKSSPTGWFSVPQKDSKLEYLVFANLAAIRTDLPHAALQITETGLAIGSPYRVWTGGGSTRGADHCRNWTSMGTDFGVYGDPRDASNWGEAGKWACDASARLYCVEQ